MGRNVILNRKALKLKNILILLNDQAGEGGGEFDPDEMKFKVLIYFNIL